MIDSDAPDADQLEQAALIEADAREDEGAVPTRQLAALEADEADALEQSIDVPFDEDYPPDS